MLLVSRYSPIRLSKSVRAGILPTLQTGHSMYVLPESRGLGAGKALMQELLVRARQIEGLEQLHLAVVTINQAAYQLYRSLGFEVYGTEPKALKSGEKYWDEYLMALYLLSE